MACSVVRYSVRDSETPRWGVLRDDKVHALDLPAAHHRELMSAYFADRSSFDAAIASVGQSPEDLQLHSPIDSDIQLFAQGLNYADHRAEGGLDTAEDEENLVFYKGASSICAPDADIIRPSGVELLDYEIELGLILKRDILSTTVVTDKNLHEYVGALILCNDVSARDEQFGAPVMQWFKGKSYRTFCPSGPVLYLMDEADFARLYDLQLTLRVNGEVRQQSSTDLLIHKPPKTLTDISEYCDLRAGDCLLTGTPGGVIATITPRTALAILLNFKNDRRRRAKFTAAQKANAKYLQVGDVLDLELRTADGAIDLGRQHNVIVE